MIVIPKAVIIAIGVVGYIVILIPYWLDFEINNLSSSPLRNAVTSSTYGMAVFALMVSTIPLLIDTQLDFFRRFSSKSSSTYVLGRYIFALVYFISSLLLVLINMSPGILIFSRNPVLSYLIIAYGLRFGSVCSLMYILASVSPNICGVILPLTITLYMAITNCIRFYYVTFYDRPFHNSTILSLIFLVLLLCIYANWSIQLYRKRKTWTLYDYSMIMYMIIFLISYGGVFTTVGYRIKVGNFYSDASTSTVTEISITALCHLVSTVLMTILPGRIARLEAATNLSSIMDTKKSYVRYISHELRTPMNTVYMGINLCIDDSDLETSRSSQCTSELHDIDEPIDYNINMSMSQKQDILKDTSVACHAAIDILNDLLLYDKVENDMMVLNKTKVPIAELVHDSLKMFNIQYRQKKIELVIENGSSSPRKSNREMKKSGSCSSRSRHIENTKVNDIESVIPSNVSKRSLEIHDNSVISDEDIMELDKSKIIQVIRNVMSNALKFTPEGGQIYVNMRYEEGDMSTTSSTTDDNEKNMLSAILTYVNGIRVWLSECIRLAAHTVSCGRISRRFQHPSDNNVTPGRKDDIFKLNTSGHTGHFVLTIRDTGAGISKENQSQLFHNIIQFKPEVLQQGGGSGLGLYITKNILDKHHGKIQVYSSGEGYGTTFTIKLPMNRVFPLEASLDKEHTGTGHVKPRRPSKAQIDGDIYSHGRTSNSIQMNYSSESEGYNQETRSQNHIKSHSDGSNVFIPIMATDASLTPELYINSGKSINSVASRGLMIDIRPPATADMNSLHMNPTADLPTNLMDITTNQIIIPKMLNGPPNNDSVVPNSLTIGDDLTVTHLRHKHIIVHSLFNNDDHIMGHRSGHDDDDDDDDDDGDVHHDMSSMNTSTKSILLTPLSDMKSNHIDRDICHHDHSSNTRTSVHDTTSTPVYNEPPEFIKDSNKDTMAQHVPLRPPITDLVLDTNIIHKSQSPMYPSSKTVPILLSQEDSQTNSAKSSPPKRRMSKITNTSTPSKLSMSHSTPILHVLIVDDSSMNRKMMARLLSSVQYTYNEAGDGVEAVQIMTQSMKKHPYSRQTSDHVSDVVSGPESIDKTYEKFLLKPFDVILMDFMMPNMDGPTATAEIRKLGYKGPIYGVTGNAQQFDIDHFIEKGADKVFIKPLVITELTNALKLRFLY